MPTLEDGGREPEEDIGLLATHFGGRTPLSERFRQAQIRAEMFGDPGEPLTIGRYTLTGRLGSGAMGTVYRATDASLDRDVAVKVLHRRDETHRVRMTTEAKSLAKLSHPNVVTVHEVGVEDEQLFVAMEMVQGTTLSEWHADPTGPSVLEVFVQAADGLQAAHDAGIVHRDFKPDNVIVGDDGRVRVLDFGMARSPGAALVGEVDGEPETLQAMQPAVTRTGVLAGTPAYMAPEQFEGARVDAHADQFAFCVSLHEIVWGTRPFAGETVAELALSVLRGEPELFGSAPRVALPEHELQAIRSVIERGLAKDPSRRFASMRALSERLRGTPERAGREADGRNTIKLAVGVLSVAAVVAGLVALVGYNAAPNVPTAKRSSQVVSSKSTSTPRCGLGTELRNGACVPLEWDPSVIKCEDDTCSVSRSVFFGADGSPPALIKQVRIVPTMNDAGKQLGYKVFGVRKDTAAGAIGLKNGDMLRTANGISLAAEIGSLVPLLQAELRAADELKIEFDRGGEPHTVVVSLAD